MPRETPFGKHINELITTNPSLAGEKTLLAGLTPPKILEATDAERDYLSKATAGWIHVGPTHARIRTYTFEPRPSDSDTDTHKTAILSSSFGNTSAAMLKFVPPLRAANLRVVVFDHNAHGDSDGEIFDIRLDMATTAELARRHAPLAGIIGFSSGGSISVGTLTAHPDVVCPRLVCIGPSLSVREVMHGNRVRMGLLPEIVALVYKRAREMNVYLNDDMAEDIAKAPVIAGTKALMIHDLQDPISPFEGGKWLATRFADCRFVSTTGLKHFGALKSDYVVQLATDFMIEGETPKSTTKAKI